MHESYPSARTHVGARSGRATPDLDPSWAAFDLTFVVGFSAVSTQAALLLEKGHWWAAVTGFGLGVFAISWAWVNYAWLASAYDNDDVFFRIATLIEMIGVLVIALGMPAFFHSIDEGSHVDNAIMVSGYVIMRVAAVALWLRAARHDPEHRRACLAYAAAVSVAQVGWVVLIFTSLPIGATSWIIAALTGVELAGPLLAMIGPAPRTAAMLSYRQLVNSLPTKKPTRHGSRDMKTNDPTVMAARSALSLGLPVTLVGTWT